MTGATVSIRSLSGRTGLRVERPQVASLVGAVITMLL